MILTEEWLKQAKDKYYEARRLIDEESKKDTISAPYKSKYEAQKLLHSIESDLNASGNNNEADAQSLSKSVLVSGLICYDLAVISYETEEFAEAEDLLKKCLSIVKGHETKPECCIISVSALNQLGILWSGRSELQKACKYLKGAENIYIQYHKIVPFQPPLDPSDFFEENSSASKGKKTFEKAHTHTLYYLAQVYKNLEENEKSAAYCQVTLKRQLESKEYDPIEWSLNCATLSQYLSAKDNFTVGKHFLASAQHILTCYESELLGKDDAEEKWDKIKNCKASIAKFWIEYGLLILHLSQQELLLKASFEDENCDKEMNEKKDQPKSDTNQQSYTLLAIPEVTDIEKKITDKLVLDFEQARSVFLYVQNWINVAKEYFVLDGHTTDHVHVIQEYSRLYKLLAFFEPDADRQCKMHKRRIDILEEVLKQLNLQYYLLISRQLMFEIAETYSEIMDIKFEIMEKSKDGVTPHAMKKINALACKSIQYFQKFVDTLKGSDNKLPETYADDVVRPALVAHFCIGRIFSKFCVEPREKLENLKKTERYYKYIIKYVDRNPSHSDAVRNELPLIKEMVQLMPGKMQSVISNTMY